MPSKRGGLLNARTVHCPEFVDNERAIVTAGLANEVEAVNQCICRGAVHRHVRGRGAWPLAVARVNVRFGSKADIGEGATDVRFTPKSGHSPTRRCVPKGRSHEVGFTRKLKPYFSKIDFAVRERRNDRYCAASDAVNATG